MPLDPRLILQQQPVASPMETLGQVFALKQAQQHMQAGAFDLEQKRRAVADQQAADVAWQSAITPQGFDEQKLLSHLPGHQVPAAMEHLSKIKKSAGEALEL